MKLTGPDGIFELNILDYECSDSPYFMDRNWLIVSLKTNYEQHDYVRTASILSTWELELLLKWMRSVADNHELSPKLSFVDPALGFSNMSPGQNDYRFRIKLSSDALPNWKRDRTPFYFRVAPDKSELQKAIVDLEKQLNRFPIRE
jgi:hypothetical protein